MAIEEKQNQILSMIKKSASVVVCLPQHPTTDAIAAGLATSAAVEKLGKRVRVVSSDFRLPDSHAFLPKSNEIFDDLTATKQFVISLNLAKASVEELSYDIIDDTLEIFISPKDGTFSESDVSTNDGQYGYDLVIVLDSPDLESLGRLHEVNAEFFYHTPVVNIDHNPDNEHYGQVDMVNVTATSISEIIFEMIKEWGDDILDEYIATNLLTGMISKTRSFRAGSVTPRSLSIASHLISQGARRDDIVKHLYQSKKVSTLKLWGRVLSKLESDKKHKIVWSILHQNDFKGDAPEIDTLTEVIDELIINTPEAKNIFILYDTGENGIRGLVSTAQFINAKKLFDTYVVRGSEHFVSIEMKDKSIDDAKNWILQKLRSSNGSQ